ncbi:MAG: hypothetical protein L0226_17590 [Acidobacteria bacterium]|nr:hypothetical protein [Acidobacteriota bacterium]
MSSRRHRPAVPFIRPAIPSVRSSRRRDHFAARSLGKRMLQREAASGSAPRAHTERDIPSKCYLNQACHTCSLEDQPLAALKHWNLGQDLVITHHNH